jgi:hypothetical protein
MPGTAGFAPGGMVYHVLNRGLKKQQLFFTDEDYLAFERVTGNKGQRNGTELKVLGTVFILIK